MANENQTYRIRLTEYRDIEAPNLAEALQKYHSELAADILRVDFSEVKAFVVLDTYASIVTEDDDGDEVETAVED